ncbi:hypothetical protein QAD02_024371 [Eretmocerus hayati]|uniref:Uncharacterized protein n=1 Tax=Eretmocerus hayati TaxID=131215 RepID=A0ACC2Q062_9HYME|nr:hypothetical protein QAD02_024371 [Eretmocerus hayati]
MLSPEAEEREELSPRRCSATTRIECPLPSYEEVISGVIPNPYKPRPDSVYEVQHNDRNHQEDPGPDKKAMAIVLLGLILIPMCAMIITIQVRACTSPRKNGTLGSCENRLRDTSIQIQGFESERESLISKILELEKQVRALEAQKGHPQDILRLKNLNPLAGILNSIQDDILNSHENGNPKKLEQKPPGQMTGSLV